jgi:DNA repair exonuclease SbcCD ATPase subunit
VLSKDIELDFFLNYLQTSPASLLKQNDKAHLKKVAELTERIEKLNKKIAYYIEVSEDLPLDEVKARLTTYKAERDILNKELSETNAVMLSKHNTPQVIDDLKKIVFDFNSAATGSAAEGKANGKYVDAASRLEKQLADNETRKKLLPLMGSLVKNMIFDLEKGAYQVVLNSGETSEPRFIFY